ncbi:PRS27 protease, partial [Podargus strigoides]|nr:PRS27 protease [Podargus strigoides]
PRRLRQVEVPLLAQSRCRSLYSVAIGPSFPARPIRDDMLCAGDAHGRRDTCKVSEGAGLSPGWPRPLGPR